MVILHIGSFGGNLSSGIAVVVPQHVKMQQRTATVALLNVNNHKVEGIKEQLEYKPPFSLASLPAPFNKPDLAVFHSVYIPAYIKIADELTKANVPYVIAPHGSLTREAQMKKWWKKLPANMFAFRKFFKNAVAYQYLSEREQLASSAFKGKCFIGTNGITIPEKQKELFSECGGSFTYIGRLETKVKGLDLLIEAVAKEKEFLRKNMCSFSICGPDLGNERTNLNELIRKNGLEDIVSLNDGLFGKEKEEKLLQTDIFVQTSRTEAMPMGIIEALSYGIPCLVTESTSLGTMITEIDGGWSAQANPSSIADKIVQVVEERRLWQQKSKNARKLIEEKFDWNKIVEKTIKEYKKLI